MRKSKLILSWMVIAIMALTTAAFANTTIYTDSTTFSNNLSPGYYLEDFNAYGGWHALNEPQSFSKNGFSYEITTGSDPGQLWTINYAISTEIAGAHLYVTALSGTDPVQAVGGQFFGSDWDGNVMAGTLQVSFFDALDQLIYGTSITMSNGSPRPFLGIISDTPIAYISLYTGADLDPNSPGPYPSLDHLYVGSVPLPPGALLLGSGLLGLVGLRWRRKGQLS
jgi:hypothetical protein